MKKILSGLMMTICLIACAFSFTGCGDDDNKLSCTLTPTAHVHQVQINIPREDVALIDLGPIFDKWSASKQIVKGKEYDIGVVLDSSYELGTLKMFINETEITLSPMVNSDTGEIVPSSYTCKYIPIADFIISFTGEVEKTNI